jgi:6-phosphogluconolactonase/glucosamine-6-phosphate isomerase/deaminase
MEILVNRDIFKLQTLVVDNLVKYFIDNKNHPILFFYSGGSAMELYPLLFERIKDVEFKEILFAPLDERKDVANSNYEEFKKLNCYHEFMAMGATFLHCGDLSRDLQAVADNYDELIEHFLNYVKTDSGKIVGVFGMGEDGHTAGIFPYAEDKEFFEKTFIKTDRYVAGVDVGEKNKFKERITLTSHAFEEFDKAFVYVSGKKKKDSLMKALDKSSEYNVVPARLWWLLKDCEVYTDIEIN